MERTTVGSIMRSTQAYCLQLCEKETLDYGIAYFSERFAKLPEANQFREVMVGANDVSKAFAEAESFFRERNLRCYRWAPAADSNTPELTSFLIAQGFTEVRYAAMRLSSWPEATLAGRGASENKIRILPARAMRAALRATFTESSPRDHAFNQIAADACGERIDDPQLDMFVAMIEGKAAGRCGLYQVGDIARVIDLYVAKPFLNQGAEEAQLGYVLSMAHRLAFRNVCAQVALADAEQLTLMEKFGFVADGNIHEFHRSADIH